MFNSRGHEIERDIELAWIKRDKKGSKVTRDRQKSDNPTFPADRAPLSGVISLHYARASSVSLRGFEADDYHPLNPGRDGFHRGRTEVSTL